MITDKLHGEINGTFVSTPKITQTAAVLQVHTRIKNEYGRTKACRLKTVIVDAAGVLVCEMTAHRPIPASGEYEFLQQGQVPHLHLWDIDDPYLYRAYSVLSDGEAVVDTYETIFGIRSFYFTADQGFFSTVVPLN